MVLPNRAVNLIACLASLTSAAHAEVQNLPLLGPQHLIYKGAFRLPRGGSDADSFRYGGRAIAYNETDDTLYITGHKHHQKTAQISIPNTLIDDDPNRLEIAELLQPFSDSTSGLRRSINPKDPNSQIIGGQLVYGDKLLVNVYSSYDGEGTQRSSLFISGLALDSATSPDGPYRIGRDPHRTSAYMAHIPAEWQQAFGGPLLAGNCCRSIIGFQSSGPAVSVFDPGKLKGKKIRGKPLLGYPLRAPLGPGSTTKNPMFNLTTRVEGVVFPDGTRSVLFFGSHGIGDYCYGQAEECGDPAMTYKGTHAYPYVYQVWAYDALDLLRVRRGKARQSSVEPYKIWTFNLPYEKDGTHAIGGVAFDSANSRLFLSQLNVDLDSAPIIHVFEVCPEAETPGDKCTRTSQRTPVVRD